jgi:hypothetical protein
VYAGDSGITAEYTGYENAAKGIAPPNGTLSPITDGRRPLGLIERNGKFVFVFRGENNAFSYAGALEVLAGAVSAASSAEALRELYFNFDPAKQGAKLG